MDLFGDVFRTLIRSRNGPPRFTRSRKPDELKQGYFPLSSTASHAHVCAEKVMRPCLYLRVVPKIEVTRQGSFPGG